MDTFLPKQNKDYIEGYAELHKELVLKGIKTTTQLQNIIKDNLEFAIAKDKQRVANEIEDAREAGIVIIPDSD